VKRHFLRSKWLLLFIVPVLLFAGVIFLSPFGNHNGFSYKLIKHSVDIDAPAKDVFNFLGNSANASKWSVFVDHINPLNNDSIPDGKTGSTRRCFCNANEKGTQWDEVITEVIPGRKRQILIYNMKEFSMSEDGLATEQLYESTVPGKTRLTFTVFYKDREPGITALLKTYIAAYRIKSIFRENMINIKNIVEQNYIRSRSAAASY
jgi:hypothetical protein